MARKLNRNLVALGSAAVVTVYAIGFARSGSPSGSSAEAITAAASPTPTPRTDTATAIARAVAAATAAPRATSANPTPSPSAVGAAVVSASGYHDGDYAGSGSNRFGGVDVSVTIKGGVISHVTMTKVTTRYPASRIAQLPSEVLDRQSAAVDLISGATYSSRAFHDAVTQALAQAAIPAAAGASQRG